MKNRFESLKLNVQVQLRKRKRKIFKKWGSTTSIKKWGNGVMGKKKRIGWGWIWRKTSKWQSVDVSAEKIPHGVIRGNTSRIRKEREKKIRNPNHVETLCYAMRCVANGTIFRGSPFYPVLSHGTKIRAKSGANGGTV